MNKENNNYTSGGINFAEALTIVFVVLKLCGIIKWSWVWVLSPIWIGLAFVAIVLLIIALFL